MSDDLVKPPFYFDRYINGVRMAEDVCVERETTLESAMLVAARIASKGPNGEATVLVYCAPVTAPDTDLLFDAYKGLLILHRTTDRMGLALESATASRIADKIVAAHPEFPARTALRHTEEPK